MSGERADDAGAPSDAELAAELDVIAADVADARNAAERQRDEYLDTLQRLQAEFENYRKRVARASEESAQRAAGDVVAKLLVVLDAFDLAAAHFASLEGGHSDEAVALAQAAGLMLSTLAKEGLQRVDEVGVAFDPTIHDAVAHEPGDAGPVVDAVLRAGYLWRGGVLRPAMVRVKG
ncbi:MAG: nucleotide exchange factor GrpE [Acidimicrobiales bacterium]